jgi:hypothetical protein
MSDEELGLIRLYTHSYFHEFNSYLRGKETKPPLDEDEKEKKFVSEGSKKMESALAKLPNSTNPEFYRGMSSASRTVEAYSTLEPGDVISDKGFCSFTSDQEIARDFMSEGRSRSGRENMLFVGRSKKLKNVAPISGSPSEAEHLAMPGTEFIVKSNTVREDRTFGKIRVIEIEDYD